MQRVPSLNNGLHSVSIKCLPASSRPLCALQPFSVSTKASIGTIPSHTVPYPLHQSIMENTPLSSIQARNVRRKESFVRRAADSSELPPSPHSSIYEAFYFSSSNSEDSNNNNNNNVVAIHPQTTLEDPPNLVGTDESSFLYGRGTVLQTITEQKSIATINTSRTKSVDDLPQQQASSLSHRDSFTISSKVRRKQSFSLDDLIFINRSYHNACRRIARQSKYAQDEDLPIHEIYAEPKSPLEKPPERPPTPEGMPSWTESQLLGPGARLNVPGQSRYGSRLQRLFRIQPPGSVPSSGDHSASAPVRGGWAPRFRPPRSVYGQLDTHPFANAPVAKFPPSTPPAQLPRPTERRRTGQSVPSRPSAGADSSQLSFHTAPQSQSPSRSIVSAPDSPCQPRQCPHRKGRLAALKALAKNSTINNGSGNNHPSTYMILPSEPSSATTSPVRASRISADRGSISVSAPAPNASHSTNIPSEKKEAVRCWKCKLEDVAQTLDQWWVQSAGFLCFVCCGIDFEDEDDEGGGSACRLVTVREWDHEMQMAHAREERNRRRIVLEGTPGVGI